jgi:hypothetical protein
LGDRKGRTEAQKSEGSFDEARKKSLGPFGRIVGSYQIAAKLSSTQ